MYPIKELTNSYLQQNFKPSMQTVNQKIRTITSKYQELKEVEDATKKQEIALYLIKLCAETEYQIQKQNPSALSFRQKTHVSSIKNTAIQVNKQCLDILEKKKRKFDLDTDSAIRVSSNEQDISKKVGRLIVEKQLKSRELKITGSQLEELANQMQRNLQIQEKIKSMVVQQGGDIELISQRLDKVYENIDNANQDLMDAAQIQLSIRLGQIRLGITGIIALIGYGILGIPGMIIGGIVGLYKSII